MKGDAMNIYIGNLSLEMTKDELRQEFAAYGEVISVTIMSDKYIGSGQPRGYGYIEMASKEAGKTAIANLEGKTINDRSINVVEALPLSDKTGMAKYGTKHRYPSSRKRERKYQRI